MANGSASIQCNNCWHFKYSDSGRNCKKYDFVFPRAGYEILCRDYRRNFIKRSFTDPRTFVSVLIFGIPVLLLYIFTGGWIDDYKSRRKRKELEQGVLYFYGYQSLRPMQPFAPFSDLQSLVIVKDVAIKFDAEYGLSINLNPFGSFATPDIPGLSKDIEVDIEGRKFRFVAQNGFNVFYCQEIPPDIQTITYRDSALLFAQTELKRYKIIPNYFL